MAWSRRDCRTAILDEVDSIRWVALTFLSIFLIYMYGEVKVMQEKVSWCEQELLEMRGGVERVKRV